MGERSRDIEADPCYQYRPLDAEKKKIRLLVIRAASRNFNGKLDCVIKHVSLLSDPPPQYETISYQWGDKTKRGTIFVDGHKMDVPASSAQVIRRMRQRLHDRTIWIDAICINQADQAERSSQVAFMGDIYSKTWQNLIWLGEDNSSARDAMEALNRVLEKEDKGAKAPISTSPSFVTSGETIEPPDYIWSIFALYNLSYFSRLWVCQEMALSPLSICHLGRHTIPLDHILDSVIRLYSRYPDLRYHEKAGQGFYRLLNIWLLLHQQRGYAADEGVMTGWDLLNMQHGHDTRNMGIVNMTLYQLVSQASMFDCENPRDRIYSLLGMIASKVLDEPEIRTLLKPNYDRPAEAVLKDAVKAIMLHGRELEFLERAGMPGSPNLPFWMPNFETKDLLVKPELRSLSKPNTTWEYDIMAKAARRFGQSDDKIDYLERANLRAEQSAQHTLPKWILPLSEALPPDRAHPLGDFFRCDQTWSSVTRPSIDGNTLTAGVLPLSRVAIMSEVFRFETFTIFTELLHTIDDFTDHLLLIQAASEKVIEGCMSHVLIADTFGGTHRATPEDVDAYKEFMDWVLMGTYTEFTPETVAELSNPSFACQRYYLSMIAATTNRRLFYSAEGGFVGLGPSLMEEGDVIAILFGSRRPVVLRTTGEGVKFQFVGLCYVLGAMFGEVVKPLDDAIRTHKLVQTWEIV